MPSDYFVGSTCLITSVGFLAYLFIHLILIPLLPLDSDHPLIQSHPLGLMFCLALFGLIFIGSLSVFTVYELYKSAKIKS